MIRYIIASISFDACLLLISGKVDSKHISDANLYPFISKMTSLLPLEKLACPKLKSLRVGKTSDKGTYSATGTS